MTDRKSVQIQRINRKTLRKKDALGTQHQSSLQKTRIKKTYPVDLTASSSLTCTKVIPSSIGTTAQANVESLQITEDMNKVRHQVHNEFLDSSILILFQVSPLIETTVNNKPRVLNNDSPVLVRVIILELNNTVLVEYFL